MTLTVHAKTKEEICQGCQSYANRSKCWRYRYINDDGTTKIVPCYTLPFIEDKICPCSSCIIKSICNDLCEDYAEYYRPYPQIGKELKNEDK